MERFDEKTGNLNNYIIKGSEMSFISISNEISDSKPDDSLIYYEDNENNSLSKYNIYPSGLAFSKLASSLLKTLLLFMVL